MEISESMSIDDLLQIVFDEDKHSGVERMYACQCIRRKFEAAQQSVEADVCRYRWGEGMETGEHTYVKGVCGKCGKHR